MFLKGQSRISLYTSTICFAEIRKGIEKIGDVQNRTALKMWLDNELRPYFGDRALELDEDAILAALTLVDDSEKRRKPLAMVDVWVAAVAKRHALVVVTRNDRDFIATGIPVFNPWTGESHNGA
jgi:predicted nucleic acid-binding protein